jgi:hypothetical protein
MLVVPCLPGEITNAPRLIARLRVPEWHPPTAAERSRRVLAYVSTIASCPRVLQMRLSPATRTVVGGHAVGGSQQSVKIQAIRAQKPCVCHVTQRGMRAVANAQQRNWPDQFLLVALLVAACAQHSAMERSV